MGNTKEIFFEKHLIVKVKNTNFHFVILFFYFRFSSYQQKKCLSWVIHNRDLKALPNLTATPSNAFKKHFKLETGKRFWIRQVFDLRNQSKIRFDLYHVSERRKISISLLLCFMSKLKTKCIH